MFWDSQEYKDLMQKWNTPTIFDLLGLAHDEKVFTRMIHTSLNASVVGNVVAGRMFSGIVSKIASKEDAKGGSLFVRIHDEIGKGAEVSKISLAMERPIEVFQDGKRFTGYIDLLVDVIMALKGEEKHYRVIIENKVGTQEHKLGQHEDGPWQTVGYRMWGDEFKDIETGYVFLAPYDEVPCHCDAYSRLNYQEIADVLTDLKNEVKLLNVKTLLGDFVNLMSPLFTANERVVMALTDEDKKKLEKFWQSDENREQLLFFVDVMLRQKLANVSADDCKQMQTLCEGCATALSFRIGDSDVSDDVFRQEFTKVGRANRLLTFADGHEEQKPWVLRNLGEDANLRGNVQSQNWWRNRQKTGLISVVCQIEKQ